jgi:hypothetical protein
MHARKVDRGTRLSNELDSLWRGSLVQAQWMKRTKKTAPAGNKTPRRPKSAGHAPGIRETEEARALLQGQLHSLYWWIFNACRIKGFIRAKHLDERVTAEDDTMISKDGHVDKATDSSEQQLR